MCHAHQVRVRGVILNRVLEDNRAMIMENFPNALKRWNITLMGAIPYVPYLNIPMMKDFEGLLQVELLSGQRHRLRHFRELRLVAGSLDAYFREVRANQLIITPACRDEIILATLEQQTMEMGMILTGDIAPKPSLLEQIKKSDIPVLYAPLCSFEIMKMITSFTAKIQKDDLPKIEKAIGLIEQYVDFSQL
jgi:BioD-like phosphotransacetylase family protein